MHSSEDFGPGGAPQHPGHTHARKGDDACCRGHHAAQRAGEPAPAKASGGCCGGSGASGGGGCCSAGFTETEHEGVFVFSRRQVRELDRLATTEFAIPSILLMENAARGISGVILDGLQGLPHPTALVVCGPGNNGGDGLAIARHLHNRGVDVAIVLAAAEGAYAADALTNLTICRKMGLPIVEGSKAPSTAIDEALARVGDPDVIVDALLGTGLDRPAAGPTAELIGRINALKAAGSSVVAVDVPSGLDCDTGEPAVDAAGTPGPAVTADLTVVLAGVKAGFLAMNAQKYVGELIVVDIGAPTELLRRLGHPLGAPAHKD
jgi:NAD(P)H-hydrate epimerase